MRNIPFLFLIIISVILTSCICTDNSYDSISKQDKAWIPYKHENEKFIYENSKGLADTLTITRYDTSDLANGVECGGFRENKLCILKSSQFADDFQMQLSLDPYSLIINVTHFNKNDEYEYSFKKNTAIVVLDSVKFNMRTFNEVLKLKNIRKTYEVYYNKNGLIRYILSSDTFDLKLN